jgi:hypothetical protein
MWNPDTGQITSDHQSLELGSDNEALKRVLGQRPGDLSGRTLKKLAEPLARLFRNGVLGRSLPDDEIVHLGSHY